MARQRGVKDVFAQHPAYGKIEIVKDLSESERVVKARHELLKQKYSPLLPNQPA